MEVDPVRVGVLGLGLAGRNAAREIARSSLVDLAAVCDLNENVTGEVAAALGARSYSEYERMCAEPSIEAIFVATPTHLRLPHIALALEHGKHVMSEKPLARSGGEARGIAERVSASGRVLASVNTRGRDPVVQAMARLIRASEFGAVLSVTNIMYKPWLLSPRYDYEMDPDLGGGVNFRQAPHQVEIARTILDEDVLSVSATVGHVDSPVSGYGNFNALLRFRSGAAASLVFNGYGYFDSSELTGGVGEGGRAREPGEGIRLRQSKAWTRVKYADSPAGAATAARSPRPSFLSVYGLTIVSCAYADLRPSPTGVVVYDSDSIHEIPVSSDEGGIQDDFREFYEAVRDDRPCRHDAAWGVATVDICEAMWRSANEGSMVRL